MNSIKIERKDLCEEMWAVKCECYILQIVIILKP